MIELMLLSLVIALVCNGVYIVTQENMLFYWVRVNLNKVFISYNEDLTINKVSKIYYPILYCIRCMPSLWGAPIVIAYYGIQSGLLWQLPLVLLMSVTLSSILHQQYD